ncbi:hypothetical protein E2C01_059804 [Portunus trituberculatus]|uniref:Uncharacterized protein n=1 Tax=Portunus trituberculatus TaxID=210409 RepID=A0A5B7H6U5_PORTR|nr:hypothetical protein [Portunus trituberculatus]
MHATTTTTTTTTIATTPFATQPNSALSIPPPPPPLPRTNGRHISQASPLSLIPFTVALLQPLPYFLPFLPSLCLPASLAPVTAARRPHCTLVALFGNGRGCQVGLML